MNLDIFYKENVKLFKEIYIDDYEQIKNECSQYSNKFRGIAQNFYKLNSLDFLQSCPSIKNWFTKQKIFMKDVFMVVLPPKKLIPSIHIDSIPKLGEQKTSLNIPISGCLQSYTKIYKLLEGNLINKITPDGAGYITFSDNSQFLELASYVLDKPIALNTIYPHGIINYGDHFRISLSFRFTSEPSWLYE